MDVGGTERRRGIDLSLSVLVHCSLAVCLAPQLPRMARWLPFASRRTCCSCPPRLATRARLPAEPSTSMAGPGASRDAPFATIHSCRWWPGSGGLRAAERKVLTEMGAGELLERHDEVVRARRQEGRGRGQTDGLCRDCISSTLGLLKKKFQTRGSMMGIQPRDGLDAMPRSP